MGERGQEFVLAAIGFLQRLDGVPALGDVGGQAIELGRLTVGAVLRAAAGLHPAPLASARVLELELDHVVGAIAQRLLDDPWQADLILRAKLREQLVAGIVAVVG